MPLLSGVSWIILMCTAMRVSPSRPFTLWVQMLMGTRIPVARIPLYWRGRLFHNCNLRLAAFNYVGTAPDAVNGLGSIRILGIGRRPDYQSGPVYRTWT